MNVQPRIVLLNAAHQIAKQWKIIIDFCAPESNSNNGFEPNKIYTLNTFMSLRKVTGFIEDRFKSYFLINLEISALLSGPIIM